MLAYALLLSALGNVLLIVVCGSLMHEVHQLRQDKIDPTSASERRGRSR